MRVVLLGSFGAAGLAVIFVGAACSSSSGDGATPAAAPVDAGEDALLDAAHDADATPDAAPDAAPACPPSAFRAPAGACVVAGIGGCAATFLDADGACRPTLAKCPAGTIAKLGEGCVAVGLPACAPAFLGADGLCHPTAAACADGELPLPDVGCTPLDEGGCGAAPFGDLADGPTDLFVAASAAPGGDGSKSKPFGTLAAALAKAVSGARVRVAAGKYAEALVGKTGVEVTGRCPSMVTITGTTNTGVGPATIFANNGSGFTVRRVTVSGKGFGAVLHSAKSVVLDHVRFRANAGGGVLAFGATTATLDHVLVDGTLPDAMGGFGDGLEVDQGAKVSVTASAFVANLFVGVLVAGGNVTLDASLVEGTLPEAISGAFGRGVSVDSAGSATIRHSAIARTTLGALYASGAGVNVVVEDSLVEGAGLGKNPLGYGIEAEEGAHVSVARTAILASMGTGVQGGSKSTVELTGCFVADTLQGPTAHAGTAAQFQSNAVAKLTDTTLARSTSGLALIGASATANGLVVASMHATDDGLDGFGIIVADGSTLQCVSCAVHDAAVAGVIVSAATASLSSSAVWGTRGGSFVRLDTGMKFDGVGDGVVSIVGAATILDGVLVESCARAGVVFAMATGGVTGTVVHGNVFGVVAEGATLDTMVGDALFDNPSGNFVSDGTLPVPDQVNVPKN